MRGCTFGAALSQVAKVEVAVKFTPVAAGGTVTLFDSGVNVYPDSAGTTVYVPAVRPLMV